MEAPQIAILGAGIFVRTEYIPRLAEISELFTLRAIWSRTEESARGAADIAKEFFPKVERKWGDSGLDDIIQDASIVAVLVVLAAQFQVDLSLRLLRAGKHVLQEKPAAASITEVETALSSYNSLSTTSPRRPIWAVAENYRFEPGFVEGSKLMADIGDIVNFQITIEAPMTSSNPYFSSTWRHNFTGGYILDMGVHFIAALRMLVGCEVTSVSAMTSHVDATLPPPDSMCSLIQLENGRCGVLVTAVSGKTTKGSYRFVGSKGTLGIEFGNRDGEFGFSVAVVTADGEKGCGFYPFSGVNRELKAFFHDVSQAILKKDGIARVEPRLSLLEGARDLAVLDAMLESGKKLGALTHVKKI